jgi:hypothetical protein
MLPLLRALKRNTVHTDSERGAYYWRETRHPLQNTGFSWCLDFQMVFKQVFGPKCAIDMKWYTIYIIWDTVSMESSEAPALVEKRLRFVAHLRGR